MQNEYQYTKLTPTDLPLLHQLLTVFGEAFDDVATYQHKLPSDDYLLSLLSKPDFIALVATQENENSNQNGGEKVVGGIVAYELQKFEQDRREIYIYDLAVSVDRRRKGIATGLINKLKEIAKDRGAYIIFVQADKGDDPAIALYESLGKKEEVYHFDIEM